MIELTCVCGNPVSVSETTRSAVIKCPACGNELTVAGARERVTDAPPSNRPEIPEDDRPRRRRRRRYKDKPEPWRSDGQAAGTSPKSIVSLVLGLASFLMCIVTGLPALIVGFKALGDIANSRGSLKGKGMAITGIALGIVSMVLTVVLVPMALILPYAQKTREANARMQASYNMKQLTLAAHNYVDSNGRFPEAYTLVTPPGGGPAQPGMNWRVALLPYIQQLPLYNRYDPKLPWDHPSNQFLQSTPIREYQFGNDRTTAPTNTYFQVFVTVEGKSPHALFDQPTAPSKPVRFTDVIDGTANTILFAEAATPVPWPSPQDMPFDPDQPPPAVGSHLSSYGSLLGMADGSVRTYFNSAGPALLKALITRDGSEVVNPNW